MFVCLLFFNLRVNIIPQQLGMLMLVEQQFLSYLGKAILEARLIRKLLDENTDRTKDIREA